MLGCGWEASLCNLCGGYCGTIAEPFWRVLGGVEADLGCRDSDEGCGVVAVVEAALVLSWFLEHLERRKSEVCSLAVPSSTKMATPTIISHNDY
jgi:hypothetical protein